MASAKRLGEVQWTKVELGAKGDAPPSPRSGHTITVVGDRAVVFGGCGITPTINGVAGEPAIFNETYFLKLAEPMTWELVDVMGDVPSPRWRHTATLLPDHSSVLVFGGLEKGKRFNDTHVFSVPDREWNIKECAGQPPHPRSHHTASLVDFEAEDELSLPISKVFVIGGYGGPGTTRDFFMDVNILELDVWSWTKVQYMKGPAPKPRSDHCVCVSGKKLILSGGRGWGQSAARSSRVAQGALPSGDGDGARLPVDHGERDDGEGYATAAASQELLRALPPEQVAAPASHQLHDRRPRPTFIFSGPRRRRPRARRRGCSPASRC